MFTKQNKLYISQGSVNLSRKLLLAQWDFNGLTTASFNNPVYGINAGSGQTFGFGQATPSLPFSTVLINGTSSNRALISTVSGIARSFNRSQTVNPPLVSAANGTVGVGYRVSTMNMKQGQAVQIKWSQTVGFRSSRYWQLLVSISGASGSFSAPSGGIGSSITQFVNGLDSTANGLGPISGTATVNVSNTGLIDFRTINGNWLTHAVTTTSILTPETFAAGWVDNISYTLPLNQGYENNPNFEFAIVGLWDPSYVGSSGTEGLVSSVSGTNSLDLTNGYNRALGSGGSMRIDKMTVLAVN
jgi:hypothetical protein